MREKYLSHHLAATVLMFAKKEGEKGVLRADVDEISALVFNTVHYWSDESHLESALDCLTDCGLAKFDGKDFFDRFYKIEYPELAKFVKEGQRQIGLLYKSLDDGITSAIHVNGETYDQVFLDLYSENKLLQKYHDFGDKWLLKKMEKINEEYKNGELEDLLASGDQPALTSSGDILDSKTAGLILDELAKIEKQIDDADLDNQTKSQALAFVVAIRSLSEAPEPPKNTIWALIEKANSIAGIASLFVSLLALVM